MATSPIDKVKAPQHLKTQKTYRSLVDVHLDVLLDVHGRRATTKPDGQFPGRVVIQRFEVVHDYCGLCGSGRADKKYGFSRPWFAQQDPTKTW